MLSVLHVLGSMLMMFSITYVLPVVTSIIYADGQLFDFVVAALVSLAWAPRSGRRRAVTGANCARVTASCW
jgi:Trk-type K+ transport system membrane component